MKRLMVSSEWYLILGDAGASVPITCQRIMCLLLFLQFEVPHRGFPCQHDSNCLGRPNPPGRFQPYGPKDRITRVFLAILSLRASIHVERRSSPGGLRSLLLGPREEECGRVIPELLVVSLLADSMVES